MSAARNRHFYFFEQYIHEDSNGRKYIALDDMLTHLNAPYHCPRCQTTDCWPPYTAEAAKLGRVMGYLPPCSFTGKPARAELQPPETVSSVVVPPPPPAAYVCTVCTKKGGHWSEACPSAKFNAVVML